MTREEAIKRFENVKANALVQKASGVSEYWQNEIDGTIEAIDMAIEALQQTAWIPVGERLPDANGLYLVTSNKWGEWEVFAEIFYDGEWVKAEPVAWMPLPEPYKGGEEE